VGLRIHAHDSDAGVSLNRVTGARPREPMRSEMDLVSSRAGRLRFAVALLLIGVSIATSLVLRPQTAAAAPVNHGGALAGSWVGVLKGPSSSLRNEHIVIFVNATQSAGTWKLSATCHGRLTLDSVSGGYHHYRRRLSPGASCAGGDIDCLMRVGANLYDTVTPHTGGVAVSGTLRRA
jgi:hypothetical protein